MDCSAECNLAGKQKRDGTWEEDGLVSLLEDLAYYRTNPAVLDRETELWTKTRDEAEVKRVDICVQMTTVELKQSEQREKLKEVSEKKQQCNETLMQNGVSLQRHFCTYRGLKIYLTKKNNEFQAKKKELEDVHQRRQQIMCQVSHMHSIGYPQNSAPFHLLAVEDFHLLTKQRQLLNELEPVKNEILTQQDQMKQVSVDTSKLRSEEQQLKQQVETLSSEENCLQGKLQQCAQLLDELKYNLKMAARTETAATKSLLKLVFIKSIIKIDERQQSMLEAVDMDVHLIGNLRE